MKKLISVVAAMTVLALGSQVKATTLVINGNFEKTTHGAGMLGYNTDATGWTTTGYNRLFTPGTADSTGSDGQFGNLQLWGPNNGSANGLPATSPAGGNFVAFDPAFEVGALSQTITGLTAGQSYKVGFWWAGAQQEGFTGATTEGWQVSLGGDTKSTAIVNNASHGFTGWTHEVFTFKADNTSDVLSFLPLGGPPGVPPFALLDGVTMGVPEPATWTMMILGIGGIGAIARRRRSVDLAMAAAA